MAGSAADGELAARIESFELAYRMQTAAPEAFDVNKEPESVRKLYGLDQKHCSHMALQCLTARRLVERGVRFVQIYSGGMENQLSWDCHIDLLGNHGGFAAEVDQPFSALLEDLAQRGLMKDVLVVGRRGIRPPAHFAEGREARARSQSPRLHRLAGWVRASRAAATTARPTTSAQGRGGQGERP